MPARHALIEMQGPMSVKLVCVCLVLPIMLASVWHLHHSPWGFLCAQTDEEEPMQLHLAITAWNDTGLRGVIDNPQDRIAPVKASLGIWL